MLSHFLTSYLTVYLAFYLTFDRTFSSILSHRSGILSGNLRFIWHSTRIFSDINSDILSDKCSGILSDICSDILSNLPVCSGIWYWHSIWHLIWQSVWHICGHTVILSGILSEVSCLKHNRDSFWHIVSSDIYLRHMLTPSYPLSGIHAFYLA